MFPLGFPVLSNALPFDLSSLRIVLLITHLIASITLSLGCVSQAGGQDQAELDKGEEGSLSEAVYEELKESLDDVRRTTGSAPSLQDYRKALLDFLRNEPVEPKGFDLSRGWSVFIESQSPAVSKHDLAEIVTAQREAIYNIELQYSSKRRIHQDTFREVFGKRAADYARNLDASCEFYSASYGERVLSRLTETSSAIPLVIRGYDGDILRTYRERNVSTTELADLRSQKPRVGELVNTLARKATIGPLSSKSEFIQNHNPLYLCMALDATSYGVERDADLCDLVYFLSQDNTAVLERTATIHGRECYVITNGGTNIYVAPELGFAVTRYEMIASAFRDNRFVHEPSLLREMSEFEDTGLGSWFPRRISERIASVSLGKEAQELLVHIEEIRLNKPISDEVFVVDFPDGTTVTDAFQKTVYTQGALDSFNAAKPSRFSSYLVIANLFAVVLLVILLVKKRRKACS